jgi:hypothetical protein
MSRRHRDIAALNGEIAARDRLIAELRVKLDAAERPLEDQIAAAEKRSDAIAAEMKSLDESWSRQIEEVEKVPLPDLKKPEVVEPALPVETAPAVAVATAAPPPPPRAAGNVVSLAARIKALQKDLSRHNS